VSKKTHFKYILAIDCETTGLCFGVDHPTHNEKTGEKHQALSWGFIVCDSVTLEPIEKLYLEVKWNDESIEQRVDNSNFGTYAEKIHGLSIEYLEEHGITEEDAVVELLNMLGKYWGPDTPICLLGHNVVTFDMWFLKQMTRNIGIELKFGNRHVDTFGLGKCTIGSFDSNELFEMLALPERDKHNAMEDIEMTLESASRIKTIFELGLGG